MKRWQIIFAAIFVAILSGLSGYYFQQLTKDDVVSKEQFNTKKSPSPEEVIGTDVAEFSLLDLNGERRYLSEWKGKLIAINFWATSGMMAPFYELLKVLSEWLVKRGVKKNEAQKYITSLFVALSEDSAINSKKDLKYLVKESQTPGGLNEQAITKLRKNGFYRNLEKSLDASSRLPLNCQNIIENEINNIKALIV